MYEIPLSPVPNQRLTCTLGNQELDITLNTRFEQQLYITIKANGRLVVANRLCLNLTPLIGADYVPIEGNLAFVDTQGSNHPHYKKLGERYRLIWGK